MWEKTKNPPPLPSVPAQPTQDPVPGPGKTADAFVCEVLDGIFPGPLPGTQPEG